MKEDHRCPILEWETRFIGMWCSWKFLLRILYLILIFLYTMPILHSIIWNLLCKKVM